MSVFKLLDHFHGNEFSSNSWLFSFSFIFLCLSSLFFSFLLALEKVSLIKTLVFKTIIILIEYFLLLFLSWSVQCLLVILSVAFFTLFERKVIGFFMIRVGPNKPGFLALLQPLLDALKLFTKQNLIPYQANKLLYSFSPHFALFLSLLVWFALPSFFLAFSLNFSLFFFFCVSSLLVFPVLFSGWSSNSKYSLIGSLRSVAQSISYESVFRTLIVILFIVASTFRVYSFFSLSSPIFFFFIIPWIICTLAETHRAPFDFRESESELVRGFNTEYGGAYFSFIFLSEYGVLIFSCLLISILFFSFFVPFSPLLISLVGLLISFVFIWIRITFCRFRYDLLIIVSWKILLPLSLNIFFILLMFFSL